MVRVADHTRSLRNETSDTIYKDSDSHEECMDMSPSGAGLVRSHSCHGIMACCPLCTGYLQPAIALQSSLAV